MLDSSYSVVERFESSDDLTLIDGHDFEFVQEGNALLQLADVRHERYQTNTGIRPIVEGVIQTFDIATKRIMFEWHSLDHIPVSESCLGMDLPDYMYIQHLIHNRIQDH